MKVILHGLWNIVSVIVGVLFCTFVVVIFFGALFG